MICLMITMNHRAGIRVENHWRMTGILSMGKINPERRIVGSINPIMLKTMAICWVLATVEISTPSDSARTM